MKDILNKLTPSQRNIIVLTLIFLTTIGIIFGFYFVFYKPKADELIALESELAQKKRELSNIDMLLVELQGKQRTLESKEKELKKMEKGLPEEEYVPRLLTDIEDLASEIHIKVASIAPGEATSPSSTSDAGSVQYKEMTLAIPFEGSYPNLKEFLRRLANFPMVVVVNSLAISKTGSYDVYDGTPVLNVTLPCTIYLLPKGHGGESGKEKIS